MIAGYAIAGLLLGTTLPRVVERAPGDSPLVKGASLPDMVPFVRWFTHRGKSRATVVACELGCAALYAALGARFGFEATVLPFLVLFPSLLALAIIDLEHYRLPDRVVFPTFAAVLSGVVVGWMAGADEGSVVGAVVGAVGYCGAFLVLHLVSPAKLGFGDVKLAAVLGLGVGWVEPILVFHAVLLASIAALVPALVLLVIRRKNVAFPFGPALAIGAVAVVIFSNDITASTLLS